MKIEVAAKDVLTLRRLVAEKYNQVARLPVVIDTQPEFESVRDECLGELEILRKLHGRLTKAAKVIHGHECNPEYLIKEFS